MAMTKGERDQLLQLIKKRERVMKTKAQERSAALMAEFDAQSAKVHHWDEDATWRRVMAEAEKAVEGAKVVIAVRCKELGIPVEFAPSLTLYWHGRGQNAVSERRAELRRAAKSKVEAIEKEALSKIEVLSLDAQTEIVAHGLESDAARAFLEKMPAVEALMPSFDVSEIQALVEARRADRQRRDDYYLN
jgi:hypothetical protein